MTTTDMVTNSVAPLIGALNRNRPETSATMSSMITKLHAEPRP